MRPNERMGRERGREGRWRKGREREKGKDRQTMVGGKEGGSEREDIQTEGRETDIQSEETEIGDKPIERKAKTDREKERVGMREKK